MGDIRSLVDNDRVQKRMKISIKVFQGNCLLTRMIGVNVVNGRLQ